jgi:hypothetical protein
MYAFFNLVLVEMKATKSARVLTIAALMSCAATPFSAATL